MSYITRETTESEDRGHAAGATGKGRALVAIAINHFFDEHHGASVPELTSVEDTVSSSVAGVQGFTGVTGKCLISPFQAGTGLAIDRISFLLRFTTVTALTTLTFRLLDSSYNLVGTAVSVLGDFAVTADHYWYTAHLDAGVVALGTYYVAIEVPTGTVIEVPYITSSGTLASVVLVSDTVATVRASAQMVFLPAKIHGKCAPLVTLDGMEADIILLPGRKS